MLTVVTWGYACNSIVRIKDPPALRSSIYAHFTGTYIQGAGPFPGQGNSENADEGRKSQCTGGFLHDLRGREDRHCADLITPVGGHY